MIIKPRRSSLLILLILFGLACGPALAFARAPDAWPVYADPDDGFTLRHPPAWQPVIAFRNGGLRPGVIERRIAFSDGETGVHIDVFPNPDELDLNGWFDQYQARYVPADGVIQRDLRIAGQAAIYSLHPGSREHPPRHTVILSVGAKVYRIEYLAWDGGGSQAAYREMLSSLTFPRNSDAAPASEQVKLYETVTGSTTWVAPLDQQCCGYSDPNPNHYPCYQGNCTWWAKYRRPDAGGTATTTWGDAMYWTARAAEEGFTVSRTPIAHALAATPREAPISWTNHVAYVESFDGAKARMTDMDYGDHDCRVDDWLQTNFYGIEFIYPRCCGCGSYAATAQVDALPSSWLRWSQVARQPIAAPAATDFPALPAVPPPAPVVSRAPIDPQRVPPASESYAIAKSVFGSGGGYRASPGYQLHGTSGQPATSALTAASYRLRSGYWRGCAMPAGLVAPQIARAGPTALTLTWPPVADANEYRIYRGSEPYFALSTPYATTGATTWTDTEAAGDPEVNYTYAISAANGCGATTATLRVGEFDFALAAGNAAAR